MHLKECSIGFFIALALAFSLGSAAAQAPAGSDYRTPRTSWGTPDFQGVWTSDDGQSTPLQRPEEFGDRLYLTDEELSARTERDNETRGDTQAGAGTFVGEVGTRTLPQTSLIVEPADGRLPETTAEARQRAAARIDSYMGTSVGRWDGDSLVVETINFNDRLGIARTGTSRALRLTERFTRVSDETIHYEVTVEDPDTWERPWKVLLPLSTQPGYQVFPFECHEGNYALRNILNGARLEEHAIQEALEKGLPPPPPPPADVSILPRDPSFGRPR